MRIKQGYCIYYMRCWLRQLQHSQSCHHSPWPKFMLYQGDSNHNNNNCSWFLEMRQPISQVNARVSDFDNTIQAINILKNVLEMTSWQLIWTWSWWIVTISNNILELLLGERSSWRKQKWSDFIKNTNIHTMIKGSVEE